MPDGGVEEKVLGQVERIEVAPWQGADVDRRLSFVVEVVLLREQGKHDHLPPLLSFRVHSPTRNLLGSDSLEVGKVYEFHLSQVGDSIGVVRYELADGWNERETVAWKTGDREVVLTLKDLMGIRNAFSEYARVWENKQDGARLSSLMEHAVVHITADGARIGVCWMHGNGDSLRLEYRPRPISSDVRDTFGFSARVERREDGWSVTEIDHVHERWQQRK